MTTTARPRIAAGTYRVDPARTTIRIGATHAFGLGPVRATMSVRSGTIVVGADPTSSTVTAQADAHSFTSDKQKRDRDIRSKRFLHADGFGDLVFTSTGLRRDGEVWRLDGELTVRGVTAPVTFE